MRHAGKGQHGIEVEGLVRQFKDVRAVDGIDLRIEPGQIYGFLGPNGRLNISSSLRRGAVRAPKL